MAHCCLPAMDVINMLKGHNVLQVDHPILRAVQIHHAQPYSTAAEACHSGLDQCLADEHIQKGWNAACPACAWLCLQLHWAVQ